MCRLGVKICRSDKSLRRHDSSRNPKTTSCGMLMLLARPTDRAREMCKQEDFG